MFSLKLVWKIWPKVTQQIANVPHAPALRKGARRDKEGYFFPVSRGRNTEAQKCKTAPWGQRPNWPLQMFALCSSPPQRGSTVEPRHPTSSADSEWQSSGSQLGKNSSLLAVLLFSDLFLYLTREQALPSTAPGFPGTLECQQAANMHN